MAGPSPAYSSACSVPSSRRFARLVGRESPDAASELVFEEVTGARRLVRETACGGASSGRPHAYKRLRRFLVDFAADPSPTSRSLGPHRVRRLIGSGGTSGAAPERAGARALSALSRHTWPGRIGSILSTYEENLFMMP